MHNTPNYNGDRSSIPLAAGLFLVPCLVPYSSRLSSERVTQTQIGLPFTSNLIKVFRRALSHKALCFSRSADRCKRQRLGTRLQRTSSVKSSFATRFERRAQCFPNLAPSHRTRRICDRCLCVTGATGLGDTARTATTTHVSLATQGRSCGRMQRTQLHVLSDAGAAVTCDGRMENCHAASEL
jgi:hypothetical protein